MIQENATIVVLSPLPESDTFLSTPVAKTIKTNFPGASIVYWTSPDCIPLLLSFCPYIDDAAEYDPNTSMKNKADFLLSQNANVLIDLTLSKESKSFAIPKKIKCLHLTNKKSKNHVSETYLSTVISFCPTLPNLLFPTIFPQALSKSVLSELQHNSNDKSLLALNISVPDHYPSRAWLEDGWTYLLEYLIEKDTHNILIMGDVSEGELSRKLSNKFPTQCTNLCGKADLVQSAAIIKACDVIISGDDMLAHLAVCVNTPVLGLYGPTDPAERGPYSFKSLTLSQNENCRCENQMSCRYTLANQPGDCMHRIMLSDITEKLKLVLLPKSSN